MSPSNSICSDDGDIGSVDFDDDFDDSDSAVPPHCISDGLRRHGTNRGGEHGEGEARRNEKHEAVWTGVHLWHSPYCSRCSDGCVDNDDDDDDDIEYQPVTTHSEHDGFDNDDSPVHARRRHHHGGHGWASRAKMGTFCCALCLAAAGVLLYAMGVRNGRESHVPRAQHTRGAGDTNKPPPVVIDSTVRAAPLMKAKDSSPLLSSTASTPPMSSTPSKRRRAAFVCITGQLPRLELQNKIDNLFVPFHSKYGLDVDVALVLSDTDNRSVKRVGERAQQYFTIDEVADELDALPGVKVLNRELDTQSEDPVLNMQYLQQRGKDSSMSPERLKERVQNHVRQFESLARCEYYLSNSPRSTLAAGEQGYYDLVHRIREDSGYYQPVDYDQILSITRQHPKTIVPPGGCGAHGGINDRGAFVSPRAAYEYFVNPILHMYLRPIGEDVRNTEKFLKEVYERGTCRIEETEEYHIFRIWTGEDGSTTFSPSDLHCIDKMGLADDDNKANANGVGG